MTTSDLIGTIGVILMLTVFILNIADRLHNDSPFYIVPNMIGAGMACAASVMINYLPFVILEGTWCVISIWAFFVYLRQVIKKEAIEIKVKHTDIPNLELRKSVASGKYALDHFKNEEHILNKIKNAWEDGFDTALNIDKNEN